MARKLDRGLDIYDLLIDIIMNLTRFKLRIYTQSYLLDIVGAQELSYIMRTESLIIKVR